MSSWTEQLLKSGGEVLGYLVVGAALVILDRVRAKIMQWRRDRGLHSLSRAVQLSKEIHAILVELRVRLRASRTYVVQFHNGEVFTSENPIYKMSVTQESVRDGVSREIKNCQSIPVNWAWEAILPVFGDDLPSGVRRFPADELEHFPISQFDGRYPWRRDGAYLLFYNPHSMDSGWVRGAATARGATAIAVAPLVSNRQVLGFVVADYTAQRFVDGDVMPEDLHYLAEAAGNVLYELQRVKR